MPEGVEAVPLSPLKDGAFAVGKLHKGTGLEEVLKIYGYPQKRTETTHLLKLTYEKEDLAMRVILRKPVAPALKENNIDKNRIQTGVESVYLTKGDSVIIGDDLTIGTPVEILNSPLRSSRPVVARHGCQCILFRVLFSVRMGRFSFCRR